MKKLCFILLILLTACHEDQPKDKDVSKACINQRCFDLTLAIKPLEQKTGLSGTTSLPKNKGMLFVFKDEDLHSFWMPDMNFPIDIIWINQDKKIVYIAKDAKACTKPLTPANCPKITPDQKASYVLEVNAGLAAQYNMQVGDDVTFSNLPADGH